MLPTQCHAPRNPRALHPSGQQTKAPLGRSSEAREKLLISQSPSSYANPPLASNKQLYPRKVKCHGASRSHWSFATCIMIITN